MTNPNTSSTSPTGGGQTSPALSYADKLKMQREQNTYMALSSICEKFLLESVNLPEGEERKQIQHDAKGLLGFCRVKAELLQGKIGE